MLIVVVGIQSEEIGPREPSVKRQVLWVERSDGVKLCKELIQGGEISICGLSASSNSTTNLTVLPPPPSYPLNQSSSFLAAFSTQFFGLELIFGGHDLGCPGFIITGFGGFAQFWISLIYDFTICSISGY